MAFTGLNLKQINTKLGHRRAEHTFYIDSTQYGLCTEKTYNELIKVFGIDKIDGFKNFADLKQIDTEYRTELLNQMNEQNPSVFNLWQGGKYKDNVFEYKRDRDRYHPTQKPVNLYRWILQLYAKKGMKILDTHGGSMTIARACDMEGFDLDICEIDKEYFDAGKKRFDNYKKQLTLY